MPSRPKVGEVTLTRGLTDDSSFEDWIRYKLINARLMTLRRGTRKAGDTNILTEKLVLTHEGCEAGQA